jgi:hypothetical protein
MNREKDFQQFPVRDRVRIEGHSDRLGMTGLAAAYGLVRGMLDGPSRVARLDGFDALDLFVDCLQAPKAAARQRGDFPIRLNRP